MASPVISSGCIGQRGGRGKRAWEGGRQPGGGAQRGGHGPLALLLPTPSLVLSMGPLPSGHPKEQRRLWVWVNRGLCAWENPCIGSPHLCALSNHGPHLLGLAPGWRQGQ